jgi:group II intron reverse transcriptase/maturase
MINVTEEMKQLHKLAKQCPSRQIRKDLWSLLTNPQWLAQAWEQIRRNKGSETPGVNTTTAFDADINLIHKLAKKLKSGTYRPKPVRRVYIPKTNGKTRPLGIPTIEDRIIQQALKMILEPIFEADFKNCSHGFRKNRSTHTALRDVARSYPNVRWIMEGDIEGCYDNIPHGKLMKQLERRIADEQILKLIRYFLKAGYMEDWQYHKTYSGTPQGGIISPLLANIFLHQLDEFMEWEFAANQTQTKKQEKKRVNPKYRQIENRIHRLRKKLAKMETDKGRNPLTKELHQLEKHLKRTDYYAKNKYHPCKVKYVRYADDFVVIIAGTKQEALTIKQQIKYQLSDIGLTMSEEKTKLTHWRKPIHFLGYKIHGRKKAKGRTIRPVLSIPHSAQKRIRNTIKQISSYYHVPEIDLMIQMGAMYRGWCNYYRYANAPQRTFSKLASYTWWRYAHFLAKRQKSSIKKTIRQERKAKRLMKVKKNGREKQTFTISVDKKVLSLDIFPAKTEQIRSLKINQDWEVDLKPVIPLNWQSGRSFATCLEAVERAKGICERCEEKPVIHVHHRIRLHTKKSFLARVMSDKEQKYTAKALCAKCHLEVHGGSFNNMRRLNRNAGYAERCSSSVGCAS